jgi:hypothetical protein
MAWHFARYVNRVARMGAAEYKLPMFVNAALSARAISRASIPARDLPHLMDVWRAGAPQIDSSPDIYFTNFAEWASRYQQSGNRCSFPKRESGVSVSTGRQSTDAIGFSPFAIESVKSR